MSNPDIKVPVIDSFTLAIPIAIFFLLITLTLFHLSASFLSNNIFNLVLWIGFPIAAAIVASSINLIIQTITCNTTNIGRAFMGAIPSIITIIIGLGISSISYCRIPIASVFAPFIIKKPVDVTKDKYSNNINKLKNSNTKECCIPKLSLDMLETKHPILKGISYSFYIFFSMLYGTVIGTSIARVC